MSEVKLRKIVQEAIDAGEEDSFIKEIVKAYRAKYPPTTQENFPADDVEVKEDPSQEDVTVEGEDGASTGEDDSSESQETETQISPHITHDKLTKSSNNKLYDLTSDKEKRMVKNLQDHYGEEFSFTVQDESGPDDIVVATIGDPATATKRNGRSFEIDTKHNMYKNNPEKYLQRFHGWAEQTRKDSGVEAMTNKDVDAVTDHVSKIAGQAPTESNDEKIKSLENEKKKHPIGSVKYAEAESELEVYKDEKRGKEFDQTLKNEKELTEEYNTQLKHKLERGLKGLEKGTEEYNQEYDKIKKFHDEGFGKGNVATVNTYQGKLDRDGNPIKEKIDHWAGEVEEQFDAEGNPTANVWKHTKKEIEAAAIASLKKDLPDGYGLGFVGEEGVNVFDWLSPEDEWKLLEGMSFQEIEELAGMRLDGGPVDSTIWDTKKKKAQVDGIQGKLYKQNARDATKKLRVLEDDIRVIEKEKKDLDGVRADLDDRAEKWKTGGLVELENLSKEIDGFPQPTTQEELKEYQDLVKQYNTLRQEGLALQSDTDNYNSSLTGYNAKTAAFGKQFGAAETMRSEAIAKSGYKIVDGLLVDNSDNFANLKEYESWRKEHQITHSFFDKDAWAVLGQGLINTAAKYYTGTSLWAINGLDAATGGAFSKGEERYTNLDLLNSMYEKYTDYDYFGTALDEDYEGGEGPSGILNNGANAIATGLPFMLAIAASSGKEGFKPGFWTKTLGKKALNPEFANKIRMAQTAFNITAMDNTLEGKAMGLNDMQAFAYGGIIGTVTGMTQMIMPDAEFFKGGVINKILKDGLGTTLSRFTTREGLEFAGKRWATNVLKEIAEEEAEMVLSDIAKASFGLGHSVESLELKNHLKLIHDTAWLSGGMGAVGAKKDFRNLEKSVNGQLKRDLSEHMKTIDHMTSEMTKKLKEAQESGDTEAIKAYEFELGRLKSAAEYATNFKAAINVAPENVTDADLTLLTEKIRLENLKKNQDPAFHAAIDQQLEKINEKIEKSAIQQKAAETNKKLLERTTNNIKKLAGANGSQVKEFGGEDLDASGDGAAPGSPPAKSAKEEIDDYINLKDENGEYIFDESTRDQVLNNDFYGTYVKDKKGNKILLVNKDASQVGEGVNVAAHEFLHQMLETTFAETDADGNIIRDENGDVVVNKKKAIAIGMELGKWVAEAQGQDFINSEMNKRLQSAYGGADANVQMQEVLTTLSDAIVSGDMVFEETAFDKLGGVLRRTFQKMGMDIRFNEGKDVFNFIKDYNKTVSQGKKLSKAQKKVMTQGAQVGGAIAKAASGKQVAEIQQKEDESNALLQEIFNEKNKDKRRELLLKNGINPNTSLGKALLMSKPSNVGALLDRFDGNKRKMISESISKTKDGRNVMDLKNRKGDYAEDNFFQSEFGQEIAPITETIAKRLFDPIPVNLRNEVTRGRYLNELTVIASTLVEREFDPAKQDIDKFISNRLNLRANKLASELGIESTIEEGGLGAAVGLDAIADLTAEESGPTVVDKNKVILSDRLGVRNKVDKAIKAKLPELDIENLSFKTLKDQTPEITGKMFGISPKKLISLANITKGELQSAQMFISKNADVLISMLPEGATAGGTATGVVKTLLKPFYNKTDRAKMAKTGTKAGLAVQVKKSNISKAEFLEVFGIVDGVPNRTDRNTSARVLALANQTGKMMTNQSVRQELLKQGKPLQSLSHLADGKSMIMFSKKAGQKNMQVIGNMDRSLSQEGKILFWNDISAFANENILDRNLESIKIGLRNVYGNIPEINNNIDELAAAIHGTINNFKDPILKNPTKLADKLLEANNRQLSKVKEFFNSNITAVDLFRDPQRVKNLVATTSVFSNQIFSPLSQAKVEKVKEIDNKIKELSKNKFRNKDLIDKLKSDKEAILEKTALSIAKIISMKGHLASSSRNPESSGYYLNRKQPFPGNTEFLEATLGSIIDVDGQKVEYGVTISKDGKVLLDKNSIKYNGISIKLPSITSAQSSKSALSDANNSVKLDERSKNEDIAQELLDEITDFYVGLYNNGEIDNGDLQMVSASLLSNMDSVLARAAKLKYASDNAYDFKNPGQEVKYEHMQPRVAVLLNLWNAKINGDGVSNIKDFLKNYTIQVIPNTMDKVITDSKLGESLYMGQTLEMPSWIRTYNETTKENDRGRLRPLVDVYTKEVLKPSEAIVKGLRILKPDIKKNQMFSKAVNVSRTVNPARGITVLDFDDTLATSKSLVVSTSPEGVVRKLTAEEFAQEGADLLDQGWTHDFSEFSKVVDGKVASLFNKAMKLQGKFGPENMFVLTARPAESAPAIFEFLQANGLNIPLENITGLANSTPESKALWIADKVGEGYNDFYFADDALQNVQAVKNMLDQFDVKSKVQQAKVQFSKDASQTFNNILESTTGVESIKEFSNAQAKLRGQKTKYKSIIPASAQDFQGLLYNFLGKGKKGEADMAFFKKALIDPFARSINELNASRQSAANDFENLNKNFPDVKKKLNDNIEGLDYTNDQAMRVYLWNKAGFEVPGLSKRDLAALTSFIENNPEMKAYADAIGLISKKEDGYSKPKDYWLAENIASDLLSDGAIGDKRSDFLAEWIENKNTIFSPENLNKIEAIYGSKFREALEDMLYRMETGRNRPTGNSRLVNGYMNWVNNSVGAIMFLNLRSATLQTISATNYINWSDNNPLKAGMAFANQKQFWSDFSMIWNSPYLKQRRAGNQRGVNEAELSAAVANSDNKAKAAIAWLLKKGFTPTQIADSFAISMGGATMLRNRIKKYVKEGMSQKDAEAKAWLDFQETTEVNQQSARPDMISQQQASPLGRLILAFQNTPMQYARIMNKATRDLANGRGDYKTHISKIAYYGVVQSIIFGALQSALYASLGDDDEEDFDKKKERILNQMVDSWLTGIGVGGKAIGTIKNTLMEYFEQRDKGFNSDHAYTLLTILSFSPPIGSKLRKIYSSIQTEEFNRGVFSKRGFTLDNPIWSGVGNVIEGVTNIPLGRMSNLMLQLDNAMDSNHKWWQRVALLLGQNTWDLGIKDPDIEAVKDEVKEEKKVESKKRAKIKKEQKKKEKEKENKVVIEDNKKKSKKDGVCSAVSKGGKRCKTKVVEGKLFCTVHESTTKRSDGKEVQCRKRKSDNKRCKMKTTNKSGYCYYHD